MKRTLALATTVAFAALSQAAFAQPIEITFWHSLANRGTDVVDEIVGRFNESQDEYRVVAEYAGNYDDTTTKLQAAVPAGLAPDLMMLEITRFGLFADSGVLEPLTEYYEAEGEEFLDQFLPFALEGPTYLGVPYVLPFNVSTPVMYYNKQAFEAAGFDPDAPPATWDELREMAEAMTIREGDTTTQWGITGLGQFVRWAFVAQAGGEWVDPLDNTVLMDAEGAKKAYAFMSGLVHDGIVSRQTVVDENLNAQYFTSGQSAINFDSTGGFANLRANAPFDLGVAPLPCDVQCAAPIGGAALGINAASPEERRQGAWEFLKFISQPEINAITFVETGYLPIMRETVNVPAAQEAVASEPGYSVAVDQLEIAFVRSRPPAMAAIRALEPNYWQAVALGQQEVGPALDDFAAEMRNLMNR
jgi:sn-glycerol 3-phosphate transport system substrate-binding protein